MRIAQLAPLTERVPPLGYGGTELVVALLSNELVARGHKVTLFASGDSETKADLVTVVPHALRQSPEIPARRWSAYDARLLLELERQHGNFDVVHNHMGYQALPALRSLSCATVTTCHNPVKDYCKQIYFACKDLPYVSISNAFRRLNYSEDLNYVGTVYNGIDISLYPFNPVSSNEYLLFIGRICHDKGTREAIEIAGKIGMPLKIAGKIDEADYEYFDTQIKPHLNHPQVELLGEVGLTEKAELYSHAAAVIYPLNFDEPFGLVMAEALAVGTPVLALDRGSVREVLTDGETAVIADTTDELVRRFPEMKNISRQTCRDRALQLFSKERMADEYLSMYQRLITSSRS